MKRTVETKERVETTVKESPMAWKLIGGAVGVGLASMLSKRYQHRQLASSQYGYGYAYDRDLDRRATAWQPPARMDYQDSAVAADARGYGYGPTTPTAGVYAEPLGGEAPTEGNREPGIREKASEKASELKDRAASAKEAVGEKASHLKERLSHAKDSARERISEARHSATDRVHDARLGARGRLDGVKEKIPSREDVKTRAQETWHRGVENDPLAVLFGALALGAAASFLLPVSDRERRLTEPARDRVRGKLDEVKAQATERLDQVRGQALEQLSTLKGQAMDSVQQIKGQAMETLKGEGNLERPEGPVTAHADESGVSYAATLPLEHDEQYRSEVLVEHTPGEKPLDSGTHGSYDSKLPH
ncbi:MAG: hypothetical protein M3Y59_18655 [Myxococcota bacterium]|nr:hypothetical protein [Myxococcota bacterium]